MKELQFHAVIEADFLRYPVLKTTRLIGNGYISIYYASHMFSYDRIRATLENLTILTIVAVSMCSFSMYITVHQN